MTRKQNPASIEAERLIEHVLAAINEADPAGLLLIVSEADFPAPEEEQRTLAEEIARQIRHREHRGRRLVQREISEIVRAVIEGECELPVDHDDASRAADLICTLRVRTRTSGS